MKLTQLTGIKTNILNHVSSNFSQPLKNTSNLAPLKKDIISFSGREEWKLKDINKNEFPDDLFLDEKKIMDQLENEQQFYHRWEHFRFNLSRLLAKRCNYLGITDGAKSSGIAYSDDRIHFDIAELNKIGKVEDYKSIYIDVTDEYRELEKFFRGTYECPIGAELDMDTIREELPGILRKQGWMK